MDLPYLYRSTTAESGDGSGFVATVPDLPGCSAFGRTEQEAKEHLIPAIRAWIAAREAAGDPIPAPGSVRATTEVGDSVLPSVLNRHCYDPATEAVFIGRGGKWGNPFTIGRDGDRRTVIAKHEAWLRGQPHLLRDLGELRGRHLVCFCAPSACHGDTLLRLANGTREELVAWWRDQPAEIRNDTPEATE